ncbi:hypothetical protein RhiirA4_394184, partial [Rhizophagus irregularis]
MDSNNLLMFLILLRLLQCFGSLITIIIEILRHTGSIIDLKRVIPNNYELFFEYCVMNLGFVLSALYLFQLNQRRKQGPYKLHIFVDCSNPNPNPNPNSNSNFNFNFNSNSNPNHNHNRVSNFNSNINPNPI